MFNDIQMFADKLKLIRKGRGLSQSKLAEMLGLTKQSIINYEKGISFPTGKRLAKIIEVLNVEPEQLLGKEISRLDAEIQMVKILQEDATFFHNLDYLEKNYGKDTEEYRLEFQKLLLDHLDIPKRTNKELFLMYSALRESQLKAQRLNYINEWIFIQESKFDNKNLNVDLFLKKADE